jgi:hypothetical protein
MTSRGLREAISLSSPAGKIDGAMSLLTITPPIVGQPDSTEDVKIVNALSAISTWANGNIDATNFTAAAVQAAAMNQSGQVVKGVTNIATSESRTNTAYGTLTTPGQVGNIVLANNGLLLVGYHATWQASASNAAKVAIFLGANQVQQVGSPPTGPAVQEVTMSDGGFPAQNGVLFTGGQGLLALNPTSNGQSYSGDVTTGQLLGASGSTCGIAPIFAVAGTYTVSMQFKSSSGSVTASNRKLWVLALSFS